MIIAIAKLISPRKLVEMRTVLLSAGEFGSALCPYPYRYWFVAALILLMYLLPSSLEARQESAADDPSFARIIIGHAGSASSAHFQSGSRKHDFISLPEIARTAMYRYFGKAEPSCQDLKSANKVPVPAEAAGVSRAESGINDWVSSLKVEPQFLQAAGVFVTLSKNGKTRACWGSVYPREANIARETVVATLGALSKDYRFKPVSAGELKELKIQVTVVQGLDAVSNVKMIDPYKEGVMVRSGGRGGVILPGEAVDAYYEFVLARLKAGIKPGEPCQIYKIRAQIYD
jgi:AMMECR1 domain-containing protein